MTEPYQDLSRKLLTLRNPSVRYYPKSPKASEMPARLTNWRRELVAYVEGLERQLRDIERSVYDIQLELEFVTPVK
ncbi:hypothetical protein WN943_021142 [Citrus x changshan-huyou]